MDVQLAVDALEHAVAHNMTHASFVLGDLDFEPLFFSLNRFGINVTVHYEEMTASPELLEAADVRSEMTLNLFNSLTHESFKSGRSVPVYSGNIGSPNTPIRRKGTWQGRAAEVFDFPSGHVTLWVAPGTLPGQMSQQVQLAGTRRLLPS